MKSHLYLIAAGALAFAASCSSGKDSKNTETDAPETVAADMEEAPADTIAVIPLEVKEFKVEKGDNKLAIAYPVSGNQVLVDSIRNWINMSLGSTYRGDMENGAAFFRHYSSQLDDPEMEEFGGYNQDEFEIEFMNSRVVTYEHEFYAYMGGAHGEGGDYGTTFLREDGTIFSKDCFTSYRQLHNLFLEGLKKYFKAKTDAQLLEFLIGVKSVDKLPAPAIDPWITEDGVVFSYTPYEIAPYSAGSPNFTIPLAKLEPYLNERGKAFFGL